MRGSVEVHRYLVERAVPHEFYRLEHPLRRIDEASALLGLDPAIVVAAQLFAGQGRYVLALTPASASASPETVARTAGLLRARAVPKPRVAALTGFFAEWLPPVGHERPSRAVMDATLLEPDVLYAPGGDAGVMLVIRSGDLLRATAATVAKLAVAPASPATPGAASGEASTDTGPARAAL